MGATRQKARRFIPLLVVFGITPLMGLPPTQSYRRCYVRRGTLQLCGIKSPICRAARERPRRKWPNGNYRSQLPG